MCREKKKKKTLYTLPRLELSFAAARGKTLDPNLLHGATICEKLYLAWTNVIPSHSVSATMGVFVLGSTKIVETHLGIMEASGMDDRASNVIPPS